jgi:putative mRNA 3-end processing factor
MPARHAAPDLVVETSSGLYCPPGDFHIDPWRPVDRAVITHAHADHARAGHAHYLASSGSAGVLRARLGDDIDLQTLDYGERLEHRGVGLSLHPAGHVLGSAQLRIEHAGRVWVAAGDYCLDGVEGSAANPTCAAFEPVRCDCFITESTFGLPIYRWRPAAEVLAEIDAWWGANAACGRPSLLMGYAFGKAQRLLCGVDARLGPIFVHGAVENLNRVYREAGVALPATRLVSEVADRSDFRGALIVAPPSAHGSVWTRRFAQAGEGASDAFASGWMQLRGARRRRGIDRGFVLSDHADWSGLERAIRASGAGRVIVTHGYEAVMVRWLHEQGFEAGSFRTEYGDDALDAQDGA